MNTLPKNHLILLVIIILLGAFLRLDNLEHTSFQSHVIGDLELSEKILDGTYFPLSGLISGRHSEGVQQTFGPLFSYMLAIPLFIKDSYIFAVGFVAVLNILAVIIAYKFTAEFFDKRTALITAAFYATNPWAIFFSDIMTNAFVVPFFSILFIYSLFKFAIKKQDIYIIPAIILSALMLQLHLGTLLLAILLFLTILLFRRDLNIKYFALGILAGVATLVPYLYYNLMRGTIFAVLKHATLPITVETQTLVLEAAGIPALLATNYFGKYILGTAQLFENILVNHYFIAISVVIVGLLIFSGLYVFVNLRKDKYKLFLLWLILPTIFFILLGKNVSPHFFIILYPAQFILLGLILSKLYEKAKFASVLLILVLILSNVAVITSFYSVVARDGGTNGIFHGTYSAREEVAEFILKDVQNKNIVIYGFEEGPNNAYRYLLEKNNRTIEYRQIVNIEEMTTGYFIDDKYMITARYLTDKEKEAGRYTEFRNIGVLRVIS
ncbi:MAG: glycosyltransferase family 39 protein [Nanoarchaeota archaeon]